MDAAKWASGAVAGAGLDPHDASMDRDGDVAGGRTGAGRRILFDNQPIILKTGFERPYVARRWLETQVMIMINAKPSSLLSYKRTAEVATSRNYMGNIVSLLAKGEDTGGRFALVEYKTKPGNEPPPHLHLWENELYYVLEGEMEFHHVDAKTRGGVGDTVFLPQVPSAPLRRLSAP